MANDLNRYYSNCSTSLVFREMQITRMMRDHFISTRMAIIKKKKRWTMASVNENADKVESSYIAGKNAIYYSYFGK